MLATVAFHSCETLRVRAAGRAVTARAPHRGLLRNSGGRPQKGIYLERLLPSVSHGKLRAADRRRAGVAAFPRWPTSPPRLDPCSCVSRAAHGMKAGQIPTAPLNPVLEGPPQ